MNETVEEEKRNRNENDKKKVTRSEINRRYTEGNPKGSKCEAHCSRRMCSSRSDWGKQEKQKEKKEKKRENQSDKGNNFTQHRQRQMPALYMSFFFFFFFFLDSSAPMYLHQMNLSRPSQPVYVSPCDMSKR